MVYPAGGAPNAAVRIEPERLAALVNAQWVDVAAQSVGVDVGVPG